jgi:hypothetical protein
VGFDAHEAMRTTPTAAIQDARFDIDMKEPPAVLACACTDFLALP